MEEMHTHQHYPSKLEQSCQFQARPILIMGRRQGWAAGGEHAASQGPTVTPGAALQEVLLSVCCGLVLHSISLPDPRP